MPMLARIRSIASVFWLLGILFLALSFRVVRYFDVRIEDLQFLYFPLVLLVVFNIPSLKRFAVPKSLLVLAVGLWLLAAANVEGFFPGFSKQASVVVARLQSDSSGMEARSLFLRLNKIARTYHLPSAEMMRKSFGDESSARDWFNKNPSRSLLIRGEPSWLSVVFRASPQDYLAPILNSQERVLDTTETEYAMRWGLTAREDVVFVSLPGTSGPYALLYQTAAVDVPGEPEELARHWLAWLAAALPTETTPIDSVEAEASFFSTRLDALNEASLISGPWKTDSPRAFSDYLAGTLSLLQSLSSSSFNSTEPLRRLRTAAGRVSHFTSPELFTSIFNNAALAMLTQARTKEDYRKAREWLLSATTAEDQALDSVPMRAAFYNLSMLDRSEIAR